MGEECEFWDASSTTNNHKQPVLYGVVMSLFHNLAIAILILSMISIRGYVAGSIAAVGKRMKMPNHVAKALFSAKGELQHYSPNCWNHCINPYIYQPIIY
ncbi:hypothetical protein EON65_34600 [archaeon]|nr:MAG: hypothetical protein EON65_34600 [archaeon]